MAYSLSVLGVAAGAARRDSASRKASGALTLFE
jgi:hypothetical protein